MMRISTTELEIKIKDGYSKLKTTAERDGVYTELDVLFCNKPPINFYEGMYAYSDEGGYHYVSLERGAINYHGITNDLFEISYWIYEDATFFMANEYELKNRFKNQDPRRLCFQKQLELLGLIGENYRKRGEIAIDEILKVAPYNDNVSYYFKRP